MAFRELMEKYVKQLSEANDRIFELEAAVAERESRLEAGNVPVSQANATSVAEVNSLRNELSVANTRIAELSRGLNTASTAYQLNEQVQRNDELQTQLAECEAQLAMLANGGNAPTQAAAKEIQRLKSQLSSEKCGKTKFHNQVKRLEAQLAAADHKYKSLKDDIATNEKAGRKGITLTNTAKKNNEIARLKSELSTTQVKLANEQKLHAREKKRRADAEAMLGPGGKRCKKCNPVVMELVDDDDGTGDKFEEVRNDESYPTVALLGAVRSGSWGSLHFSD